MTRYPLLLFLLLVASATAREVNLAQALQMAQQHSYSAKKARALRDGALAELTAARAERLPTLAAAGFAFYVSEVPTFTIATGPVSVSRDVGTDQTYQADFRVSMPLFTGGRITGSIGVAAASADYDAALDSADRDRTAFQTRVEYFGVLRTQGQLRAAHAALERTKTIEKTVRSQYEAGAADSVNLLEISLAVTRAASAVDQAEAGRRMSEIRLSSLLGLAPSELLIPTDSPVVPPTLAPHSSSVPERAELAAADAGVRLNRSKLSSARADYSPAVSAYAGYSYGKPNLDRFNNTWNDYFTFGANLSWSLNLGNRTGQRVRTARFALNAAQQDRNQIEETLTRDAALFYEQLRVAHLRYQSAVAEAQIAKANYRLAEAQCRDGALASNRLLEIAADLNAAEASLAAAQADFHIALSAYYYAIGSQTLRKGL